MPLRTGYILTTVALFISQAITLEVPCEVPVVLGTEVLKEDTSCTVFALSDKSFDTIDISYGLDPCVSTLRRVPYEDYLTI